jgi:putative tricarboxylic transport membrane protein
MFFVGGIDRITNLGRPRPMKLNQLDAGFGLLLLILGVWIVAQALSYGVLGSNVTGAGFFPFIAGCLLTISATGILATRKNEKRDADGSIPTSEWLPIGGIILVTVAFLLLAETVGMVLLTPFYVAAISYLIEFPKSFRGHVIVWVVGFGFALFGYLLFDYGLNVPIPHGFLDF